MCGANERVAGSEARCGGEAETAGEEFGAETVLEEEGREKYR